MIAIKVSVAMCLANSQIFLICKNVYIGSNILIAEYTQLQLTNLGLTA